MPDTPTISFVIVNYNVRDYLEQLLHSLRRALTDITHEFLVVDNGSVDGSVAHIRSRFPEVTVIESGENLGFGRANNVALKRVRGEFVVMVNPDVVVQEDTFTRLLDFFADHPEAGAATPKMLNPDGSFSVDCRHDIPTPMTALWKVLGLAKLFPRSRVFARYNLTWLDTEETNPVPAISGAFMMVRRTVLERIGHFDERFFMYCEDIDLCHRINQDGWQIWYVPTSQIIHYKGESTKKNNVDYVITFNKALYQFFEKYYAQRTLFLFRWLIVLGIVFRGVFIYLRNFLQAQFPLILDTVLLNAVVLGSFVVRMSFHNGFLWSDFWNQYWVINLISTAIFLGAAFYMELYPHHRFSIQGIVKANIATFLLLAALTFFLKQFAFSRMVVLIAAIGSPVAMIAWRGLLRRTYRGDRSAWGKDLFTKPTLIVGDGAGVVSLYRKIRDLKDLGYDLLGVVTVGEEAVAGEAEDVPVLGHIDNLRQLVTMHRARQVIFSSEMLSYERILKTMSGMGVSGLEYKIAPSNLEVMIGKSTIDRLDDYPFLEVEYAIGKPFNRFVKRAMDLLLAFPALLVGAPLALPLLLLSRRRLVRVRVRGRRDGALSVRQRDGLEQGGWLNRWLLLPAVLRGQLSLVGAPLEGNAGHPTRYGYRPGLTGLVQINRHRIAAPEDVEKYHLFYLKNQSLLLDLEILLKALAKPPSPPSSQN